ncbi:substrate-binding domain-containing protein [Cellulomonas endophytica]|uniref:substrate-binding domain-containing protein n=1 Tax=Cellulomonas endophytica TaxID=2494735 RepID=UPI001010AFC0|nr:substrate-binding domain-containing protein [Cellulomonas endophytica]
MTTDHALGADIGARHLAAQSHRCIGAIVSQGSLTSIHVLRGWRDAARALRLPVDPRVHALAVDAPDSVWPSLDETLAQLLATGVTALLVHSDWGALAVLGAAAAQGVRVPDDLGLVAYDDDVASSSTPPLTAVAPPKEEIGRRAEELLLERLERGPSRPVERVQLVPSLVVRASSIRPETPMPAHRVPARAG